MNGSYLEFGINLAVIAFALLSVVYTLGVVWRVEKRLDISYKLFLVSIVSFAAGEITKIFTAPGDALLNLLINFSRLFFAFFFLAGIFTMRSLIRKLDGEK